MRSQWNSSHSHQRKVHIVSLFPILATCHWVRLYIEHASCPTSEKRVNQCAWTIYMTATQTLRSPIDSQTQIESYRKAWNEARFLDNSPRMYFVLTSSCISPGKQNEKVILFSCMRDPRKRLTDQWAWLLTDPRDLIP